MMKLMLMEFSFPDQCRLHLRISFLTLIICVHNVYDGGLKLRISFLRNQVLFRKAVPEITRLGDPCGKLRVSAFPLIR